MGPRGPRDHVVHGPYGAMDLYNLLPAELLLLLEDEAPKDRGFQFFLEATSPIPLPREGSPTLSAALCCCFELGLIKGLT